MSIDFHNHLLPGVDDGASNLEEARAALVEMRKQGVSTIVVTPHLNASVTERPDELLTQLDSFDAAFSQVQAMISAEFSDLRIERGVELMLDSPTADLSDPRLRLAGTRYLLVEFPGLTAPPESEQAILQLKEQGWRAIIGHPERYRNMNHYEIVLGWKTAGAYLQVNAGSILGRYGERAERLATELFRRGWVDFLSSDYHCRGPLDVAECRERLVRSGGEDQVRALMEDNPRLLLEDEEPRPVGAFDPSLPFWKRLFEHR